MARKNGSRKPTMHDVADLAGVTQATVSLVLNDVGGSRVSSDTQSRVREAAAALGYRTNALAQSLRRGHTGLLGFISDEVATAPFAGAILKGAQRQAWEAGQVLLSLDTFGDADLEQAAIEMMLSYQVRAVIYASMYHRVVDVPETLADTPVVVVNAQDRAGTAPSIFPDEEQGGYTATRHLIEGGHSRVAMINIQPPQSDLPAGHGRLAGYRRAMGEAGIQLDPRLEVHGNGVIEDGTRLTRRLMALDAPPTAIFAGNDRTAWGVYRALGDLGLRPGIDCSVMGFDNQLTLAPYLDPGLTTMALPFEEMGRLAVDTALDVSHRPLRDAVECPLVVRQSVNTSKVTS